ncbi:hypothetical protein AB0P17_09145 [Streptomyces sp. NPDC088124]|uniref:hypothetical protein n=1 Tax=Streptomyces sp. NPDC088124 TaxID=3154654 RepID=UPI00343B137A
MSDYFDRLLARHTPVAAADGAGSGDTPESGGSAGSAGVTRVRPRLPGPFERVEALRTAPPEPDAPASLIPAAPQPAFGTVELVRHEREVRTDRHTVVRTGAARADEAAGWPDPAAGPFPDAGERPTVRPAPQPAAGPRKGADAGSHPSRHPAEADAFPAPREARAAPATGAPGAPWAAAPGRARPRDSDTTTARGAAQGGVGRRAPRPAERVVHVQIGRLEVSAAPPPGGPRPAADRPGTTGRRAPALTLDDYLARGERRN